MTFVWRGNAVSVNKRKDGKILYKYSKFGKKVPFVHMYKSSEYANFERDLASCIAGTQVTGLCNLQLTCYYWKGRDSDNAIKPIQDALMLANKIIDDKQIKDIIIDRHYHKLYRTKKIRDEDYIIGFLVECTEEEIALAKKEQNMTLDEILAEALGM